MHKLDSFFEDINLDKKKEILKISIISGIFLIGGVCLFLFLKNFSYLIYCLLGMIAVILFFLLRYLNLKKEINNDKISEFVKLFTFFKSYLKNGLNVYQSLKSISNFASPYVKDKLDILLREIDSDKSVTPFIKFSSNFPLLIIEQLMISIYQMVEEGENPQYLSQYDIIFNKISNEFYSNNLENKNKKLGNCTIFPLVGSALVIIIITLSILFIIGGYING